MAKSIVHVNNPFRVGASSYVRPDEITLLAQHPVFHNHFLGSTFRKTELTAYCKEVGVIYLYQCNLEVNKQL